MEAKGHDGVYVLVSEGSGTPVNVGDGVRTFRGESAVVKDGTAPRSENSTGRVETNLGEHYPSVYGLKWQKKS